MCGVKKLVSDPLSITSLFIQTRVNGNVLSNATVFL